MAFSAHPAARTRRNFSKAETLLMNSGVPALGSNFDTCIYAISNLKFNM